MKTRPLLFTFYGMQINFFSRRGGIACRQKLCNVMQIRVKEITYNVVTMKKCCNGGRGRFVLWLQNNSVCSFCGFSCKQKGSAAIQMYKPTLQNTHQQSRTQQVFSNQSTKWLPSTIKRLDLLWQHRCRSVLTAHTASDYTWDMIHALIGIATACSTHTKCLRKI